MTTPGGGDPPEFKDLLKTNQTLTKDLTKEYESK